MARVYAFEGENNTTLEWMPLEVRRKSDLAGVRMSLAAWQAMPKDDRARLVAAEVATPEDVEAFRALATSLGEKAIGKVDAVVPVPFDARPWATDAARDEVVRRAHACGIALDPARWAALDDHARYALFRLSDPKKSEDKLRAALVEVGMTTP
ncbi:MAG: hypothetical protein HYV09_28725 [Deltaproteobacteria bacterium]|nr:hypothetical protein [Deltaproteobacteria bacterium]